VLVRAGGGSRRRGSVDQRCVRRDVRVVGACFQGRRFVAGQGREQAQRLVGRTAGVGTEHALAVDGPIREYYLVDRHDTADAAAWRTEIGWPIFATSPATS
jgi:hypothetical protein